MLDKLIQVHAKSDNRAQLAKLYLSVTIVQLARGDDVAAANRLAEFAQKDGFMSTEEYRTGAELLELVRSGDQDALIKHTQKQIFNFLEAEVRACLNAVWIY